MGKPAIHARLRSVSAAGFRLMLLGAESLFVGLALTGCSRERAFDAYNYSTHLWNTGSGLKAEDRVNGRLIDPETAIKLEYRGDIYYFEKQFDVEMFKRAPGGYDYNEYAPLYGGGP